MSDLHIYRINPYSRYVAHNLMEFLNWYHKYVDSIETVDDIEHLEIIEPNDGYMWSDQNITPEDINNLGDKDEYHNGLYSVSLGDLQRKDGRIYKYQTFADVLGDKDPAVPYELASFEYM